MKGYSFRSLTDLVLKIFKTKVIAGTGLSGGGSLEADRTLAVNYGTAAGTAAQGNDSRLSNSREWTGATISQAEVEKGSATTRRAFTAQRVRQAIVAWWNSITGEFGRDLVTSASNSVARSKLGLHTSALRWPTWAEVTGKPAIHTPIGVGQTWQDVTGSRAVGTTYTNTTGKPIMVSVSHFASGSAANTPGVTGYVGDVLVQRTALTTSGGAANAVGSSISILVPSGATYRILLTGTASNRSVTWAELR